MNISVYPLPDFILEKQLNDKVVIVVDVLRATTTILQALIEGAHQVIPAKTVEDARVLAANWSKKEVLLAGEKNCIKLPGYDTGNSPVAFKSLPVKGKSVIMYTTNGTTAILKAKNARKLIIGCFRNKTAAASQALLNLGDSGEIVIICSGTANEISLDDVLCAGGIANAITAKVKCDINDFGIIAMTMYDNYIKGTCNIENALHYQNLLNLGFKEDIDFCLEEDKTNIVPLFVGGAIKSNMLQ